MTTARDRDCEAFEDLLLLSWSNEVGAADRARLYAHLESCSGCASGASESAAALAAYETATLEELENEAWPERFAALERPPSLAQPWIRAAAAALLVASGWLLGFLVAPKPSPAIAELAQRVDVLESSLSISMLRPASSRERLQALTRIAEGDELSEGAWVALLDTLESDPSPNVRLGAIDVLRGVRSLEPIAPLVGDVVLRQDSAIIAGELIELVVERRIDAARPALLRVARESTDGRLRELAKWAAARVGESA